MSNEFKFILLFFSLSVALSSCDSNSDAITESNAIYHKTPIPTLFNNSRGDDTVVDDGECVIRCIIECAAHYGRNVSRNEIIEYFGDNVVYHGGKIVGIKLNTYTWRAAFKNWFNIIIPSTHEELRRLFETHIYIIGVCRVPYERTHALILDHYIPNEFSFWCYDALIGNYVHISYDGVYDPIILHPKS